MICRFTESSLSSSSSLGRPFEGMRNEREKTEEKRKKEKKKKRVKIWKDKKWTYVRLFVVFVKINFRFAILDQK